MQADLLASSYANPLEGLTPKVVDNIAESVGDSDSLTSRKKPTPILPYTSNEMAPHLSYDDN